MSLPGLTGQSGIHGRWLLDRPVNPPIKSGEGDDSLGRIQKQVNHLGVMPRESGASSNPETRISNDLLGVTGSPAFAGDDTIEAFIPGRALRRRPILWLMGLREMRHLPDFAAIWRNRPWDEKTEIHDEHLRAAEANVDGLVEAVEDITRRKDYRRRVRGVSDEVAHHPGPPVNAGDLKASQARRPGARRNGAGLGDEDIALEAKRLGAGEIEHIG